MRGFSAGARRASLRVLSKRISPMRLALLCASVMPLAIVLFAAPAAAAASPQSKACSDQATAKNLHGAEREAFRADCMKAAGPAAPAKATPAEMPAAKAKPTSVAAPKPASGSGGATTASKACSDQATAKGLHGAEREAFRATCLQGAPSSAAKPASATKSAPAAKPTPAATSGSSAKSPASKVCSDQATAKGLHGAEREAFRAECMKSAPATAKPMAPVAKPATPVAKPVAPVAKAATRATKPAAEAVPPEPRAAATKPPAAPGTRSPAQLASDQRIKACGQQWQAAKAANRIPAGQTWPQYWSACSARMKSAGK